MKHLQLQQSLLKASSCREGRLVTRTLRVFDAGGASLRSHLSATARDVFSRIAVAAEAHFPETLGTMLIINAPSFFPLLWSVGCRIGLMDPSTRTKTELFGVAPSTDFFEPGGWPHRLRDLMGFFPPELLPGHASPPLSTRVDAPWTRPAWELLKWDEGPGQRPKRDQNGDHTGNAGGVLLSLPPPPLEGEAAAAAAARRAARKAARKAARAGAAAADAVVAVDAKQKADQRRSEAAAAAAAAAGAHALAPAGFEAAAGEDAAAAAAAAAATMPSPAASPPVVSSPVSATPRKGILSRRLGLFRSPSAYASSAAAAAVPPPPPPPLALAPPPAPAAIEAAAAAASPPPPLAPPLGAPLYPLEPPPPSPLLPPPALPPPPPPLSSHHPVSAPRLPLLPFATDGTAHAQSPLPPPPSPPPPSPPPLLSLSPRAAAAAAAAAAGAAAEGAHRRRHRKRASDKVSRSGGTSSAARLAPPAPGAAPSVFTPSPLPSPRLLPPPPPLSHPQPPAFSASSSSSSDEEAATPLPFFSSRPNTSQVLSSPAVSALSVSSRRASPRSPRDANELIWGLAAQRIAEQSERSERRTSPTAAAAASQSYQLMGGGGALSQAPAGSAWNGGGGGRRGGGGGGDSDSDGGSGGGESGGGAFASDAAVVACGGAARRARADRLLAETSSPAAPSSSASLLFSPPLQPLDPRHENVRRSGAGSGAAGDPRSVLRAALAVVSRVDDWDLRGTGDGVFGNDLDGLGDVDYFVPSPCEGGEGDAVLAAVLGGEGWACGVCGTRFALRDVALATACEAAHAAAAAAAEARAKRERRERRERRDKMGRGGEDEYGWGDAAGHARPSDGGARGARKARVRFRAQLYSLVSSFVFSLTPPRFLP